MEKSFYTPPGFREKNDSDNQCFGIEVVPGRRCTLNCEACYKTRQKVGSLCGIGQALNIRMENGDIPLEDFNDYVDQAAKEGFQEVAILGGEPTMHRNIEEMVRSTREFDLIPILVTNGQIMNDSLIKALSDSGTVVVTHAVIPGRSDVMNRFAGRPDYAGNLFRAINKLQYTKGIQLVLEMPLTGSLYNHAFDFFTYCRKNNITPFIEISRRNDSGEATTCVTPEQVKELFERFREYDLEHHPELASEVIFPPAYGNPCTMSVTGIHVKNFDNGDYGGVYSCCAQGIRHGDLKEQPLSEIMKSSTLTVFRDQDKYIVGPCKDCDIYDTCKGGCRGQAYLKFGCPRASNPSCHRTSKQKRNDPAVMAPESCEGCPLEDCDQCSLTQIELDAA